MDKDRYIKDRLDNLFDVWLGRITAFGAVLFLVFGALDHLVTPQNFDRFLKYRVAASLVLFLISFWSAAVRSRRFKYALGIIAVMVSSLALEAMILDFGGHKSSYYVGFILVGICVINFLPSNFLFDLISALIIYFGYLLPILFFEKITDTEHFITHNFFLITCLSALLYLSYLSRNRLMEQIESQYESEKKKIEVEEYSSTLSSLYNDQVKELQNAEIMLKELFENAIDGIIITNSEGRILTANRRACEMFGKDKREMLLLNAANLEDAEYRPLWKERLNRVLAKEGVVFETEYSNKDGTKTILDVSAKAIRSGRTVFIQLFYRDITEKKRLMVQLVHSQKMESIGILAGGVAHDFGNILSVVQGYVDVISMCNVSSEVADHMRVIESAVKKGRHVVSQLLAYAKRENKKFVPVYVNNIIEDMLEMVSRLIPRQIEVRNSFNYNIPPVDSDESQMEQIMMNLLVNAKDAISDDGEISVATDLVELRYGSLAIPTEVVSGSYVHIKVSDTGKGMTEGQLKDIFKPFYTTKEHGTGLGLAIVYGLVKDHHGYITAESVIGKGTTFNVYLPVSISAVTAADGSGPQPYPGVTGTVLVIDDEVNILGSVKTVLSKHSFNVFVYDNPLAALGFFKLNSKKIDLVISDLVMPKMDGCTLIKNMREIEPRLKVVAITGYSDSVLDVDVDAFMRKPVTAEELLAVVCRLLSDNLGQK
ncbi:MAG: PAS domain S-box protein [Nitrospirae bacterium]|nr:MAG: PAS domain S-box protein [Nitrospirota bacterium]